MKNFLLLFVVVIVVLASVSTYATDCNNGGRYEDMDDGTVQDCRTGLIWLNDANCLNTFAGIDKSGGTLNWYDAIKWVAGLQDTGDPATGCGLSDGSLQGDWRLPTKTEWMAMVGSARKQTYVNPALTNGAGTGQWIDGDVFTNVQMASYWSSTGDVTGVSVANMHSGNMDFGYPAGGICFLPQNTCWCSPCMGPGRYYIWPVRGGQSGEFRFLIIQ